MTETVEQRAYDSVGALLAGQRGPIHFRYRLRQSDANATVGSTIMDVTGGEVTMSNFRDHTWEISLERRELPESALELMGDYVRLFVEVRRARDEDDAEAWTSFPLGHYALDPAGSSHGEAGTNYAVSGKSAEIRILDDYAWHGYKAAKGRDVLAIAREILVAHGVAPAMIDFPGGGPNLQTDMWFDAHQDFSKCSYLRIVNAVLNAGGFYALFTDAEGNFKTQSIQAAGTAPADTTYTSEGARRMVLGEISEEYDLERFANRVIVYSGDPSKGPIIEASATNNDPDSPGSVLPPPAGIGRVVVKEPIVMQNLVSAAAAQQVANAQLKRATAVNHKVSLTTLPDPRRKPREDYELNVRRPVYPDPDAYGPAEGESGKQVLSGRWTVVGWTFPLNSPPQPMTHELTRAERLIA